MCLDVTKITSDLFTLRLSSRIVFTINNKHVLFLRPVVLAYLSSVIFIRISLLLLLICCWWSREKINYHCEIIYKSNHVIIANAIYLYILKILFIFGYWDKFDSQETYTSIGLCFFMRCEGFRCRICFYILVVPYTINCVNIRRSTI